MSENKLKICLALNRESEFETYLTRIREQFKMLPTELDTALDAKSLLSEVKEKGHDVVICAHPVAGMETFDLVGELRKSTPGINIFLLVEQADPSLNDLHVELVKAPITNWSAFLAQIQDCVPEDLKAKYGLKRIDSALLIKIQDYEKKHYSETQCEWSPSLEKDFILLIPRTVDADSTAQDLSDKNKQHQVVAADLRYVANPKQMATSRRFDSVVLVLLLSLSGALYWFGKDEYSDELFRIKNIAGIIAVFSSATFFLARILDQFLLAENEEQVKS